MDTTARTVAILATVLLTLGACSAGPSPSPSSEPTASPTPVDPADAFLAIAGDPEWAGHAEITGTISMGDMAGTVSGTQDVIGERTQSSLTVEMAGQVSRREAVAIGEDAYRSVNGGPWYWTLDDDENQTLADAISGTLVDAGTETLNGATVHRLEARDAVFQPSFFGFDAGQISDLQVDAAFLVLDDGTPLAFEFDVSWAQATAAADVAAEMSLRWDLSASAVDEIVAPSPVWVQFASDRFPYVIGYPKTWESHADEAEGHDYFQGQRRWVEVVYYDSVTTPTEQWFSESRQILVDNFGGVESEEAISVSGVVAHLFSAHVILDEAPYYFMQATFFVGTNGWDVNWYSRPGTEEEDLIQFRTVLETFTSVDAPDWTGSGDEVPLASLTAGDCFDAASDLDILGFIWMGGLDGTKSQVLWLGARRAIPRDCGEPHEYEVFAIFPASQTDIDCTAPFEVYVGTPWDDSELNIVSVSPNLDEAAAGIGSTCVVFVPVEAGFGFLGADPVTGSLRNSNR